MTEPGRAVAGVEPQRYQLTGLELASGLVLQPGASATLPTPRPGTEPLAMLERATLPALRRPPCLVAFSGGRDSSVVLAAAARAARREGLPPPIPTTLRYPNAPATDESRWQELVVGALKLPEWHRREIDDELDLLGPVSTAVLLRHGLLWPPNSYVAAPMLAEARGGSLLTGIDGDTLFGGWRWARPMAVLSMQLRPRPRDVLRVAHAFAPSAVRWRLARDRTPLHLPWLQPDAQAALDRAWAYQQVAEPRRFGAWIAQWRRMRYLSLICDGLRLLALDADVQIVHPLLDEPFLAVLARRGGIAGFGTRTAAMRVLFGELLPDELLSRCDKPVFDTAFWGQRTRAFTDSWDGKSVDPELVDERRLREVWGSGSPDFRSATLAQSVWLAGASPVHGAPRPVSGAALR